MGAFFKNYKTAKNAVPGYGIRCWVLPTDWVQQFGQVVGNAAPGSRVTIDESHVPMLNKGAIEIYCAPKSVEGPGELVGEALAKRFMWKPKFIVPGDSPELLDMVLGLVNKYFLMFIEDAANCGNGVKQYIQYGSPCDPCTIPTGNFASGNSGEGRKQYELEGEAFGKYFYNGIIQVLDDEAEIVD